MPPLQFENAEVVFQGLDQKTHSKLTAPGKLETARNVLFDKAGSLNKRRGYERPAIEDTTSAGTMPVVFTRLAVFEDELLVFGIRDLWSLADRSNVLQDDNRAFVHRGPCIRGAVAVQHVATSPDTAAAGEAVLT